MYKHIVYWCIYTYNIYIDYLSIYLSISNQCPKTCHWQHRAAHFHQVTARWHSEPWLDAAHRSEPDLALEAFWVWLGGLTWRWSYTRYILYTRYITNDSLVIKWLPSGKRLQFANWKITRFKFGKSTNSMGNFLCNKLPEGNWFNLTNTLLLEHVKFQTTFLKKWWI